MIKLKFIILSGLILLISWWAFSNINSTLDDENVLPVTLGEYSLKVPKEYLTGDYPAWLVAIEKILDKDRDSVVLRVPVNALSGVKKLNLPMDPTTDLIMRVTVLDGQDLERSKTGFHLSDLARLNGSYKNHKIEPSRVKGWYKVYRSIEYPNSWAVLKELPDPNNPSTQMVLSNWIGQCLIYKDKSEHHKETARCNTYTLLENIEIEYSIRSEYIEYSDLFAIEIKKLITSWLT